MANYKLCDADQLDADLTTVANAIRSKGGTSAKLEFPNGYKSAIEAITTGSESPVQKITGKTFTTSSAGKATVTCGFRPDAVFIPIVVSGDTESAICLVFSEQTNSQKILQTHAANTDGLYTAEATRSDTGFSITMYNQGWNFSGATMKNKTFSYTAIKYTE